MPKQHAKDILLATLTQGLESRLKVRNNTIIDPISFIENNVYIRDIKLNVVRMQLKQMQRHHYDVKEETKAKGKRPHFLLLKPRRVGFTTFEQASSYEAMCNKPHSDCLTLAQDNESTQKIFRMVKLMHDMNPDAPPLGSDSKKELSYPAMGSTFFIRTARAKSAARGTTLHRVHGSEVAFWDMQYDDIENQVAGLTEAARYGEVVFETTANGTNGWFYHKFKEAMEGNNSWTPLFYPWFADAQNRMDPSELEVEDILDSLDDEEVELVQRHDVDMGQLLWRRTEQRRLKKLFVQEYPGNWLEAFLTRGTMFFDTEMIERHWRMATEPKKDTENLTIWVNPEAGREYVAGADCAEGLQNGDWSVLGILDKASGEQVARLRGKWRPEVFARKAVDLCKKYNNALFACEINNHGHSVMNTVVNSLGYRYIYYRRDPLRKNQKGRRFKESRPGWNTNAQTRPLLLDDLNEAMEEDYMLVNDRLFLAECKTFVDNGGKYEASEGEHDDLVMAWGIAWQARKTPRKGTIIT